MAYPVIPSVYRLQSRFQWDSNLPEDVFVNTFYIKANSTGSQALGVSLDDAAGAISRFYTVAPTRGGAVNALAVYMPDSIIAHEVRVYDLGEALPRYPIATYDFTANLTNLSSSEPLPHEVALVGSYRSGQGPRRRGRMYLGPLTDNANEQGRPSGQLQNSLLGALGDLFEGEGTMSNFGTEWAFVQVSPTDATAREVTRVSVDDAWDTQRRRGIASSLRQTLDTTPPGLPF